MSRHKESVEFSRPVELQARAFPIHAHYSQNMGKHRLNESVVGMFERDRVVKLFDQLSLRERDAAAPDYARMWDRAGQIPPPSYGEVTD